ncbi:MAG: glycosyltransferase [Candidatus Bathyarchaeota archaeon]|nr:glycosyltransferase [Candidatus Bathyarchaeota archaeon]
MTPEPSTTTGDSIQPQIEKDEVTIVLPVLDEEAAIGKVLDELKREGYTNILVVDGYSQDDTVKIARAAGAQVITQHGTGKTGGIKTAIEYIKTPYLLVMDGDGTYSAKDIEKFLTFAEKFDQILGNRKNDNIPSLHRLGNWIINTSLNVLFGTSLSDVCTGMYMMRTDVARKLEYKSRGFNVEVEMAIQNLWNGSVTEVPIGYGERLGKRKLSSWGDGLKILWTVIRMSITYNPLFFLTATGALFTLPGSYLIIRQFYLRLRFGALGWNESYFYLGLILFIIGINSFTTAMNILLGKRQERRIILEIRESRT